MIILAGALLSAPSAGAQSADGTYSISESWSVTVHVPSGYPTGPRVFTKTGVAKGSIDVIAGKFDLVNTTGASIGSTAATLAYDGTQYSVVARPVAYAFATSGSGFYLVAKLGFSVVLVPLGVDFGFTGFQVDETYTGSGLASSGIHGSGTARDVNGLEFEISSTTKLSGGSVSTDTARPTVTVTQPRANQSVSNATVTATGTAADNVGVSAVYFSLNGSGWSSPTTGNQWNNWQVGLTLQPGNNILRTYAVDAAGNRSTTNSVSFNYVLSAPLHLMITGNGTVTPNPNGQLLKIDNSYTLTAKPSPGNIFAGWSGSFNSANPVLSFVMQSNLTVTATFIPNPFIPLKGKFFGLFNATNGVRDHDRSGSFTFTLTDAGAFTGSLQLGAKKLSTKGVFDWLGQAIVTLKPSLTETVTVVMQLTLAGPDQWFTGTVGNGVWSAPLSGYRAPVFPTGTVSPQAGKYTLILPGSDDAAMSPGGHGYGTISIGANGALKLAAKLADGTAVSQAVPPSAEGWWAVHTALNGGLGSLHGWMQFTNGSTGDIAGELSWIKPALAASKFYPSGFSVSQATVGSRYVAPTTNRVINLVDGSLTFHPGNLSQSITNQIRLGADNKLTNLSSNKLTMTLTLSSGLFKGSVTDTNTGKAFPFTGALLQKLDSGYGYFLGTNRSGAVNFLPGQ